MIYESILDWVPRFSFHDVLLGILVGQGDGGNDVGAQVHQEDGHRPERQRNPDDDVQLKQKVWKTYQVTNPIHEFIQGRWDNTRVQVRWDINKNNQKLQKNC